MPTELDYLRKLAKGLNSNSEKTDNKKNKDVKGNEKDSKYPASIPLRTVEEIMNEQINQDKKA